MIYLFYGNDAKKISAQCNSFLEKLFAKKPNALFFEYDAERFAAQEIDDLVRAQGLFEREHVVLLREALSLLEAKEYVIKHMESFANSPNVFIFVERELDAASVAAFAPYAKKAWESKNKKLPAKKSFNPFALGDAFAERDRRKTWAIFSRAIDAENIEPEFAHGIIFAQVKNMLLVKREEKNPGLHPFVFQKMTRFSKNYSIEELEGLSSSLVALYHDSRRGISDMRIALESLILKI